MDAAVLLSQREQEYLFGAIEAAVQVRDARQFFLWAQGQLQALLPHRLMLCLQLDGAGAVQRVETVHAGALDAEARRALTDPVDGLAARLALHCRGGMRLPAISGAGRRQGDAHLAALRRSLQQCGFDHLVVHGSGAGAGPVTLFALCGWQSPPTARHACFLALLLPQLHLGWLRAAAPAARAQAPAAVDAMARPLSARELQILSWVREGKSNIEVGLILGISAITVKNHLQRIYRALGVSNRTHALARCMHFQLLPAAQHPH